MPGISMVLFWQYFSYFFQPQKKRILKFIFVLLILMLPGLSFSQQKRKLRVMTYNILDGFNWGKDTAREKMMGKFIRSEHPDVVALEELCGFTEDKLKSFAKSWGHNYAVILKEDGYPVGLTSNKPITLIAKIMHDGLGHGMLHVATYGINFFVVHLNPGNYKLRIKESKLIREYMVQVLKKEDSLYMVLGDFNSHSPFDAFIDERRPMLLAQYQRNDAKKTMDKNLTNGHFDYSAISSFLGYPLIDVCERKMKPEDRFSFPTPILIGTWRKPGEIIPTRERIDYIFTSPQLAEMCSEATIINSGMVDKFSDHFPVMASFDLK